jgi:hypothetical protein
MIIYEEIDRGLPWGKQAIDGENRKKKHIGTLSI